MPLWKAFFKKLKRSLLLKMIHFKKKGWQLKPFYKKKKKKEKKKSHFLEVCLPKLLLFGNLGLWY